MDRLERQRDIRAGDVFEVPVERGSDRDAAGAAQDDLAAAALDLERIHAAVAAKCCNLEIATVSRHDTPDQCGGGGQVDRVGGLGSGTIDAPQDQRENKQRRVYGFFAVGGRWPLRRRYTEA
jgi:hypothetical protein